MIPFKELRERLQKSSAIENTLKRRLWILAILTDAMKTIGERPVLIGGQALEYYTLGGYTTGDIDIALPSSKEVDTIFSKLGFHKEGRYWIREDIDALIEAPTSDLSGEDAQLVELEIEDMHCYIIGLEDLIIDRLNGYVHWHWEDDGRWVKRLLSLHAEEIDKEYLFRKAREQSTEQTLMKIYQELHEDKRP
ncbi:MAG: UbiD family decarboxylase [bacterium]